MASFVRHENGSHRAGWIEARCNIQSVWLSSLMKGAHSFCSRDIQAKLSASHVFSQRDSCGLVTGTLGRPQGVVGTS